VDIDAVPDMPTEGANACPHLWDAAPPPQWHGSSSCRLTPTCVIWSGARTCGDRESVCLGARRTETRPGETTSTRHAAQLVWCHTQSGASVMSDRSVWGVSLSHAPAVCARQRRGAAPGACTPAV